MNKTKKIIKDWVFLLVITVILAAMINKFLFFEILVPSGSMYPTIKLQDRIITTRIYNVNNIKRGDPHRHPDNVDDWQEVFFS